ncbi:MAG: GGDEF domain-containing protein [Planctomycetales bacterium]|nr:GGDEF domain-containing protein [Planctomycetales bacterium]
MNIQDKIRNVESLPSPPNVAVQIVQLCQDESSGLQDLSRVLSLDPALAARVLRVSNSAAYARGREITSLDQAITTLGSRTISIVALGFSLKAALPSWKHESGVSDATLWRHSIATAVTARALARLSRFGDNETAFLCGLMSRIGQLLMYAIAPEEYGDVLAHVNGRLPSPEEESEHLGITHHEAGALLLEKWNLPSTICQTVRHWSSPPTDEGQDTKQTKLNAIIDVSDALAQMIFNDDKAAGLQRLYIQAHDRLGLSSGEIDRMFTACGVDLQETLQIFDVALNESIDCERILEIARQQLVNLSLGLVADLTEERTHTTSLQEENKQLARASQEDSLTGLSNRLSLDRELDTLSEARATNSESLPYSIMMIDVDHFKSVNDTYGHAVGDDVLRSVGACLAQCARVTDFVARYGGEEFAVVLTNAGQAEASSVAERFRATIERRQIEYQAGALQVTASFGVASSDMAPPGTDAMTLLNLADQALYQAKHSGRNRVVTYSPAAKAPAARHDAETQVSAKS